MKITFSSSARRFTTAALSCLALAGCSSSSDGLLGGYGGLGSFPKRDGLGCDDLAPYQLVGDAPKATSHISQAALAVDQEYLYQSMSNGPLDSEETGIFRAPKTGGAFELIAKTNRLASYLAVDADRIYFVDRTDDGERALISLAKDGSGERERLAPGGDFVLEDSDLYVADPGPKGASGAIHHVDLATGDLEVLVEGTEAFDIRTDAEFVYWIDNVMDRDRKRTQSVMRVAKSGGEPQVLHRQEVEPLSDAAYSELLIDDAFLYLSRSSGDNKGLYRLPKDGASEPVRISEDRPRNGRSSVVLTPEGFFWALGVGVEFVPREGGEGSWFACGNRATTLATDGAHLFVGGYLGSVHAFERKR
jgi:hypothetical protein